MAETAIKVAGVYKNFVLPHERHQSIKSALISRLTGGKTSNEVQHALQGISFDIKEGEFFGIVGRNGSGKSTLLKMLAGIYQPSKGNIATKGTLVPFIELGVGFNPELTGRENVYLNGALLGFSKQVIDSQYDQIVEFAELERFMDQKLKNYSSGMQVRLAFSVAIMADADILLVDEVLAVGDAAFQRKCFEYFRLLKKNKKTVVFVSHDMGAVREYCDRAVLIEGGKIVFAGKADDAAKEYTRLFNPQDTEESEPSQANKWGIGGLDITHVRPSKKTYRPEDTEIRIAVDIISFKDFDSRIVPGFSIKNESGQMICGTNSTILREKTPVPTEGQKITITWTIPNIFNEGTYTIEPAVAQSSTGEICQWWDNAKTFRVVNPEKTPYVVAPKIRLDVPELS
jgi:ABC-2 type transport system ATP-binding protein